MVLSNYLARRIGIAAACSTFLLGLDTGASASTAAMEVGMWLGFSHQREQNEPGTRTRLELRRIIGTDFGLQGTLNGLPAVQTPLSASGKVTIDGALTLTLKGEGFSGRAGGRVFPILGFGAARGQDDLGTLEYSVADRFGHTFSGRIALLHMFGGAEWNSVPAVQLPAVQSQGAFIPGGADEARLAGMLVNDHAGSALIGLLFQGDTRFQMVRTINGRGSMVLMGDGSVRPNPDSVPALIGLLFTGGVRVSPNAEHPSTQAVGHYGTGPFATFLPAVQHERPGAMSFNWAG